MSHWNARLSINVSSTARSNKFMLGSDKGHEYSPQLKADHQNDTEIFFFKHTDPQISPKVPGVRCFKC